MVNLPARSDQPGGNLASANVYPDDESGLG
jgi:hypothetical protein